MNVAALPQMELRNLILARQKILESDLISIYSLETTPRFTSVRIH